MPRSGIKGHAARPPPTAHGRGTGEKQLFRVEGDRAYGLAIADDKQGIAVILHALAMLRDLGAREYGTITVLVNADEEISSPGSRKLLARLGAEHDATLSFEASRAESDKLSLATAGIGSVNLTLKGKASHAGSAPHLGVNALYELAHQILQTKDLSRPEDGVKLNWTLAQAGQNRNVIPPQARVQSDVRVLRLADCDGIETAVRERLQNRLLPQATVGMLFERRRPPLGATPASLALARHAQATHRELGKELVVDEAAEGGGTDAAFAALETKNAVVERFGLQGFGAHSNNAEYVLVGSIPASGPDDRRHPSGRDDRGSKPRTPPTASRPAYRVRAGALRAAVRAVGSVHRRVPCRTE